MKIHEYQGKQLFRDAGVPVLQGHAARSPQEAVDAFNKLGGSLAVVKAQIHAGGRGKGSIIDNASQKGVKKQRKLRSQVISHSVLSSSATEKLWAGGNVKTAQLEM